MEALARRVLLAGRTAQLKRVFMTGGYSVWGLRLLLWSKRCHAKLRGINSTKAALLTIGWPMTVQAWSLRKSDESGIKLRLGKDAELTKDLEAADNMYKAGEMKLNDSILARLEKHRSKEEPELYWRLARALYEKSKNATNSEEKQKIIEEAFDTVEKALLFDDKTFGAHKWKAIILNEYSKQKGLKAQIIESFNIKFHMERALELNPKDATTWYLLGQWCFSVAEVPWYQQKIAAAVFSTPPTSTYEAALEKFLRAEEMEPSFYSMNLLMIAKSYLKLGQQDKAEEYLDKLSLLQMKTDEDFLARKEASELRNQIKRS